MNKVIWVFWPSAAGKETFIRVITSQDIEIKKVLGECYDHLIAIEESIKYIKQTENDPIGEKRIEIIDRVIELNKENNNSLFLIKWQNIDIDANLPNKLRQSLPDIEHKIVYLYSNLDILFTRVQQKSWYVPSEDTKEEITYHIRKTAEKVKEIWGMEIISIDTTDGYKITEFPSYNEIV